MLTYQECVTLGDGKKLGHNTRLVKRGNAFAVVLYRTDVVTIHSDGTFTLKTGGFLSNVTKDRLNKFGPVKVFAKKRVWYAGEVPFTEGMTVRGE